MLLLDYLGSRLSWGSEACPDERYSGKGRSAIEAPIEAQIGGLIIMNKVLLRIPVREWIGKKK